MLFAAMLAAGLAVTSADESVEPEEPVDPSIVVLEPGENHVGWIGESRSVALLRRQAPGIESVKSWDAQAKQFVDADSLDPGKGYVITLVGGESVSFRRPMTPALGKTELKGGRNLVTWLGPDDWSIDRVVLGIGRALVRVDWNGKTFRSSQGENTGSLPRVKRGDALWVQVSRAVNWLQPTGVPPLVLFPGGATQEFAARVREDVSETLRFFREYFGIEADYSQFTIYVPTDVDTLVDAILEVQPGLSEDSPEIASIKSTYFLVGSGGGFVTGDGKTLVMVRAAWDRDGDEGGFTWGYSLTVHEYTHVVQDQLSRSGATEHADVHQWMVEGNADWAQSAVEVWGGWTDWDNRESAWSARISGFGSLRDWGNIYKYALGGAATNHLVGLVGPGAILEFWRLMAPAAFGPLGRWSTKPMFEDAFLEAFNMPLESYFASFERSRVSADAGQQLRGVVVDPDGHGLPFVTVIAQSSRDDGSNSYDRSTARTAADGSFAIPVPAAGARVGVDLGGCEIYYSSSGWVSSVYRAEDLMPEDARGHNLQLNLTNDLCVWQLQGRLVDAKGAGIANHWIEANSESGDGGSVRTAADGSFSVTLPIAGRYTLSVRIDRCSVYYRFGEVPGSRQQATLIEILDGDETGIDFQLTEGSCSTKITGRLLDSEGAGIPSTWVYLRSGGNQAAFGRTQDDGSFSIIVPSA